jgi:hypothetical protein
MKPPKKPPWTQHDEASVASHTAPAAAAAVSSPSLFPTPFSIIPPSPPNHPLKQHHHSKHSQTPNPKLFFRNLEPQALKPKAPSSTGKNLISNEGGDKEQILTLKKDIRRMASKLADYASAIEVDR